jgi:3-oxoisoapionate kinase
LTATHRFPRLYAYYGDDFTGSTDVLEALALYGVPAVLFTHTPAPSELDSFAGYRAIGIAGESRSRDPHWMDRNLPEVFSFMRTLGAPVNHYKVCSTFDSAPHVGSIGRAMELGRAAFDTDFVPVVVGAPHLGRSVVYANLFAAADGVMHRIDRHPTMSRHPVTPMTEADRRLHLGMQPSMRIGSVNLRTFQSGCAAEQLRVELASGAQAIVFDGIDDSTLDETARLLWDRAIGKPVFAAGSSGLSYGLLRHWRRLGLIDAPPETLKPGSVDRLLVLSGSCSPVSAKQIHKAIAQGFAGIHLAGPPPWESQAQEALASLARAQSVVLYTALGPQPRGNEHGEQFSAALGEMLHELLLASRVGRVIIAGGDTSTHAVRQLGIDALTFAAPLTPGAPLCRCHAAGSPLDGLELALKGGQIGPEDFFAQTLVGG